jgi:hypothetical protein
MWSYNLPVTGEIPKTGTYIVGGKQTIYSTATLVNTATSFTATNGSLPSVALTVTTTGVSPTNGTNSGLWSNYLL